MDTLFVLILLTSYIVTYKALFACTSGECVIDCESDNCDIVICTNYASSCIINCLDDQCKNSHFYLAARNYNTVYCTGKTTCNEINLQCGSPDMPPIGYSEYDFIGRYDSTLKCNFVSKPQPFIAPNKPTTKPTSKLSKPIAPTTTKSPTSHPTANPIIFTNEPIKKELSISQKSATKTKDDDNSIVGTDILIVLSSIGLFCVVFTICFCICMSIDYHKKLTILRKQHEKHINVALAEAEHQNDSPIPGIDDEEVIAIAIADANTCTISTIKSKTSDGKSNESIYTSNFKCNNSNAASTINTNNILSNFNISNGLSTPIISSADIPSSKLSADISSTDLPSFSHLSPIESQQSGCIITKPIHELKSSSVQDSEVEVINAINDHQQMESETNLETKLSISNTLAILINGIHNRQMESDTFNSSDMDIHESNNGTVLRKHTNLTDVTNNTITESIPSVPSGNFSADCSRDCSRDCSGDCSGDCDTGKLYDFSVILNAKHDSGDTNSLYHD